MSRRDRDTPMDLPALDALGEGLLAAAHRQYAPTAPQPRRSSWRVRHSRRTLAVAMAAVVLLAGAAGAAQLIATGAPAGDPRDLPAGVHPVAGGGPLIAVTAADPARALPWGVATYRSADGRDCALAGEVRLGALGVTSGGRFHAYLPDRPGICGRLDLAPLVYAVGHSGQAPDRTLVFGRARAGTAAVTVSDGTAVHEVPVSPAGAFLAVLDGHLAAARVRAQPAG